MHILNGRAFGDIIGDYTCFQYNGTSVVDYCIVSESLYRNVLYFHVQDFKSLLSDHAMIVKNVFASYRPDQANSKTKLYDIPPGLCLESRVIFFLFSKALGSTDVKNKIKVFLNSVPSDDVDDTLNVFNNIIESACSLSLRKKARPVKKENYKEEKMV